MAERVTSSIVEPAASVAASAKISATGGSPSRLVAASMIPEAVTSAWHPPRRAASSGRTAYDGYPR